MKMKDFRRLDKYVKGALIVDMLQTAAAAIQVFSIWKKLSAAAIHRKTNWQFQPKGDKKKTEKNVESPVSSCNITVAHMVFGWSILVGVRCIIDGTQKHNRMECVSTNIHSFCVNFTYYTKRYLCMLTIYLSVAKETDVKKFPLRLAWTSGLRYTYN